jgi:hypothetical protein
MRVRLVEVAGIEPASISTEIGTSPGSAVVLGSRPPRFVRPCAVTLSSHC